ncbi:hypothetical protein A9Q99_16060 [Gammaproteobacteria bacterium 45_16_T64]|nr:hypothetical protein A9Q99_16060 [Gammaproteobacteria bacterium 45_16_T64]
MNNDMPTVVQTEVDGANVVLTLQIPENLKYFDGHFDQASLLPGVVQIDWAVHFGRLHFHCEGQFSSLEVIKFKEVIAPNQQVKLTLSFNEDKQKLLFSYASETGACSSGRIVLGGICEQ